MKPGQRARPEIKYDIQHFYESSWLPYKRLHNRHRARKVLAEIIQREPHMVFRAVKITTEVL